jgi:tetratricopeptide (TPR) repeat protein
MMKIFFILLIFPLLSIQEDHQKRFLEDVKRINELLDMLEGNDKQLRLIAQRELLKYKENALPFLEERISRKGAGIYLEIIKKILYPLGEVLPPISRDLPKLSRKEIEKYIFYKLCQARLYYNQGRYREALRITSALKKLEPNSIYRKKIQSLLRSSKIKIFNLTIARSTIRASKKLYQIGEKIELELELENLTPEQLEIIFPQGKGFILLQIELTYYDWEGNKTIFEDQELLKLEGKISLKKAEKWKIPYTLNTTEGLDPVRPRRYRIWASITPKEILCMGKKIYESIDFEPLVVKVCKEGALEIEKKGLQLLAMALDKGRPRNVFLPVFLLGKDQKQAGIELLIQSLKATENPSMQKVIFASLEYLTGLPYGWDRKRWLRWWEKK